MLNCQEIFGFDSASGSQALSLRLAEKAFVIVISPVLASAVNAAAKGVSSPSVTKVSYSVYDAL